MTLDRVFGAISDPTRREILLRLSRADERVTDVASNFSMSLNSVSKHVRVLESAGLVTRIGAGPQSRALTERRAHGRGCGVDGVLPRVLDRPAGRARPVRDG